VQQLAPPLLKKANFFLAPFVGARSIFQLPVLSLCDAYSVRRGPFSTPSGSPRASVSRGRRSPHKGLPSCPEDPTQRPSVAVRPEAPNPARSNQRAWTEDVGFPDGGAQTITNIRTPYQLPGNSTVTQGLLAAFWVAPPYRIFDR